MHGNKQERKITILQVLFYTGQIFNELLASITLKKASKQVGQKHSF